MKTPKTLNLALVVLATIGMTAPVVGASTFTEPENVAIDTVYLASPLDLVRIDYASPANYVFARETEETLHPDSTKVCYLNKYGLKIRCDERTGTTFMGWIPSGTKQLEISMKGGLDVTYQFNQVIR